MKTLILLIGLVLIGCSDEPAVSIHYGEPYFIQERHVWICPMKKRCIMVTYYDTIYVNGGR